MKYLVDTHFHIDHYRDYFNLYSEINRLKQYTICVTNSPGVYVSCCKLFEESKYIRFALGFNPKDTSLSKRDFIYFMRLFDKAKYIGEIGLDFSRPNYLDKKMQLNYFEEITKISANQNKLMTVHIRKAEEYALEIIDKYKPQKCIIHWYNGNKNQLDEFVNLGCYFSINSNMITNKKKNNQLLSIPTNKLLVESDGPYSKVYGKKFSPELLNTMYYQLSEFFKIQNLDEVVYSNFRELLFPQ